MRGYLPVTGDTVSRLPGIHAVVSESAGLPHRQPAVQKGTPNLGCACQGKVAQPNHKPAADYLDPLHVLTRLQQSSQHPHQMGMSESLVALDESALSASCPAAGWLIQLLLA